MTRNRLLLTGALLLGPAIVVAGFFYDVIFAGIPYQDPTPELQSRYFLHSTIASHVRWCGVLWMAALVLLWVGYKVFKK
jgi:hypothetical protein